MKVADLPANERARLAALHDSELLDSLPEQVYDDLTRLAALIAGTPIALVSLVDASRQWFKAKVGLDASETSRDVAFCAHAILGSTPLVVPDALADERFYDNPLVVGPTQVRAYLGAPLVTTAGLALGTLCAIDHVPRTFSLEQRDALPSLARQVIGQIELRRQHRALDEAHARSAALGEQLADLLDHGSDLVQSVGPDGRFLYANRVWREKLGYSAEEALALTFREVVAPECSEHCEVLFGRLMSGEPSVSVVTTFLSKDGARVRVDGTVSARPDRTTRGIFKDVTERDAARAELDAFFELSLDMLCIAGFDGYFKRLNPAWTQVLGYSMEELLAAPFVSFVHPDDVDATLAEAARLAADALTHRFQNRYRCKDGTYRWLLWTAAPDRGATRIIAAARDITEIVSQAAEIRAQEARHRALLAAIPEEKIRLTRNGDVLDVRTRTGGVLSVDGTQDARSLEDLLPSELVVPIRAAMERATSGGDIQIFSLAVATARPCHVEVRVVATESDVLVLISDITERKQAERAKSEFVATVSHELRTPLTSIRGSLRLMQGGIGGALSGVNGEMVAIAVSNTERLLQLINDILDLEKMTAGKLELRLTDLDPSKLVTTAASSLEGMASEAGVTIVTGPPASDGFLGDEGRLVQVLSNLVSNAIKFSARGTEVRLESEARAAAVRFSVIDRGPGIAAPQLAKLFTRFQQLDGTDARPRGGTGLGLAISKSIVEQHGGRIGVESELGTGSTFWFEIPAHHDTDAAANDGHCTVLLVEDNAEVSTTLRAGLSGQGYRVLRVATLAQAMRVLDGTTPDIVLLELGLPDGDGLTLTEHMRSVPRLSAVPVILVSGADGEPRDFGCPIVFDWLQKPVDPTDVAQVIRRALRVPGSPRVLVADDDPSTRALVKLELSRFGIECVEATDGMETIRLARDTSPDLIVLDIGMPRLDGFGVVEVLRKERARMTPLIVYSGRDTTRSDRQSLSLGLTRHLTKGRVSEGEFIETVLALLDGLVGATAARGAR